LFDGGTCQTSADESAAAGDTGDAKKDEPADDWEAAHATDGEVCLVLRWRAAREDGSQHGSILDGRQGEAEAAPVAPAEAKESWDASSGEVREMASAGACAYHANGKRLYIRALS
jgi:hypothetical protein